MQNQEPRRSFLHATRRKTRRFGTQRKGKKNLKPPSSHDEKTCFVVTMGTQTSRNHYFDVTFFNICFLPYSQAQAEPFHFLQAQPSAPLATPRNKYFKPPMKVLSRAPKASKASPQLFVPDDDGGKSSQKLSPEDVKKRQEKDLEEKQRRYEQARARIFGTTREGNTIPGTGPSGKTPVSNRDKFIPGNGGGRVRVRGRGGGGGGGGSGRNSPAARVQQPPQREDHDDSSWRDVTPKGGSRGPYTYTDPGEPRRASSQSSGRGLYDPNAKSIKSASRPSSNLQSKDKDSSDDDGGVPIRQPRGPDGTRGFNFRNRER